MVAVMASAAPCVKSVARMAGYSLARLLIAACEKDSRERFRPKGCAGVFSLRH
jgi:hypothetical protein